jgi:hypothetical protein
MTPCASFHSQLKKEKRRHVSGSNSNSNSNSNGNGNGSNCGSSNGSDSSNNSRDGRRRNNNGESQVRSNVCRCPGSMGRGININVTVLGCILTATLSPHPNLPTLVALHLFVYTAGLVIQCIVSAPPTPSRAPAG